MHSFSLSISFGCKNSMKTLFLFRFTLCYLQSFDSFSLLSCYNWDRIYIFWLFLSQWKIPIIKCTAEIELSIESSWLKMSRLRKNRRLYIFRTFRSNRLNFGQTFRQGDFKRCGPSDLSVKNISKLANAAFKS